MEGFSLNWHFAAHESQLSGKSAIELRHLESLLGELLGIHYIITRSWPTINLWPSGQFAKVSKLATMPSSISAQQAQRLISVTSNLKEDIWEGQCVLLLQIRREHLPLVREL